MLVFVLELHSLCAWRLQPHIQVDGGWQTLLHLLQHCAQRDLPARRRLQTHCAFLSSQLETNYRLSSLLGAY